MELCLKDIKNEHKITISPTKESEIRSEKRNLELVFWRILIAGLMWQKENDIYKISKTINRSRSTSIYYVHKFDNEIKYNKNFINFVNRQFYV